MIGFKGYPEKYEVRNEAQVWPSGATGDGMKWEPKAEFTISGDKWQNDNTLDMWGDPTSAVGATIRLNTSNNKDCNALWNTSGNFTERQVRGLFFYTYNNGAKHNPRITGVAMKYSKPGQSPKYVSMNYRSNNYCSKTNNNNGFPYIGQSSGSWWQGVIKKDTKDGDWFHQGWFWSGVVFHWECTFKVGSAINNDVYIWGLRPIVDGGTHSNLTETSLTRVWGARSDQ